MTLLDTDIEGPTRLLAELRSGYVDVLAEHRRGPQTRLAEEGRIVEGGAESVDLDAAMSELLREQAGSPVP